MSGEGPGLRCELKYPLSPAGLWELRWWHRCHGAELERTYPTRTVNSIYFDSPDWDSYAANLSGVSRRSKCRLRWYGEAGTAEEAFFEAKHRRNGTGRKGRQGVSMSELGLASLPTARLYERLRSLLQPELRLWLDQCHTPALYNRYRREYYATKDGLRMTVDTDIAYAPLHGGSLRELRLMPSASPHVVEFKYPPERRRRAEELLRRFPVRATRSSKYVVGIDHLLPH
jgi:hypothetical protein